MRRLFLPSILVLCSLTAAAQTSTQALSQCLADSTTGKDRKDLARWVFFAMAAHPEIEQYAAPAVAEASEEAHKAMAATFTRLLAESCVPQTQAAFKEGGSKAIEMAFQTLGQLAMQEIMSNPNVNAGMTKFEKFLDRDKLSKAFGGG